jgi:hypothetical protein
MKTRLYKTLLVLIGFTLATASCKKADNGPAISNDEAANSIGDVLAVDVSGSASDASSVSARDASNAGGRIISSGRTLSSSCDIQKDTTLTRASAAGALITYSYTGTYTYTLACTGFIPSSLVLSLSTSGSRTGTQVFSTGTGTGSYTLTGFAVSQNNYALNGTFTRDETITEIVGQKSFTGTTVFIITDVTIDKTTKIIQGGTATFTMSGTVTNGAAYAHSGTITFNGNSSATLTVNGNSYTVNLTTGVVTKM